MADAGSGKSRRPLQIRAEINSLPPLPNHKKHWRRISSDRKKWRRWSFFATVGQKPPSPFLKARLTLTRHSSSEPDYDGLVASFKSIIDGLVDAGILANDKMSNIGIPTYRWMYAPPKLGKISIVVEEAPHDESQVQELQKLV